MNLLSQAARNVVAMGKEIPIAPEPWMQAMFRQWRRHFGVLGLLVDVHARRCRS